MSDEPRPLAHYSDHPAWSDVTAYSLVTPEQRVRELELGREADRRRITALEGVNHLLKVTLADGRACCFDENERLVARITELEGENDALRAVHRPLGLLANAAEAHLAEATDETRADLIVALARLVGDDNALRSVFAAEHTQPEGG